MHGCRVHGFRVHGCRPPLVCRILPITAIPEVTSGSIHSDVQGLLHHIIIAIKPLILSRWTGSLCGPMLLERKKAGEEARMRAHRDGLAGLLGLCHHDRAGNES